MIADAGETTALTMELRELDLVLDELGRLFVVENDGRGWPWGPEEDGADHHRLDGMPARVGYRSMIVPDLPADT